MPSPLSATLRNLRPEDIPEAFELSSLAGWNQTPAEWRMMMALEPEGCFAIEADGRVVATTTLICHGARIAWLGMVLTHPQYRRQGFARRLMSHALEHARLLGIPTVKLDATDEGRPLYETFGFRAEQPIERWARPGPESSLRMETNRHFHSALDTETCGYDRARLLHALSLEGPVSSLPEAHLFLRPGRVQSFIGPCVATQPTAARDLLSACFEEHPSQGWCWDILPANNSAVSLATQFGFTRQRVLTRMVWGQNLNGRDEQIVAAAGFALG